MVGPLRMMMPGAADTLIYAHRHAKFIFCFLRTVLGVFRRNNLWYGKQVSMIFLFPKYNNNFSCINGKCVHEIKIECLNVFANIFTDIRLGQAEGGEI